MILNTIPKYLILSLLILKLSSCRRQTEKIDYEVKIDTVATVNNVKEDTTKILIAELPFKFDSTGLLIYAVGLVNLEARGRYNKYGSNSSSDVGVSYFNRDDLIGNYINLIFQEKDGSRTVLTKYKMSIRRIEFLSQVFKQTKKGHLIYTVYDRDTNGDGEMNRDDLKALYISKSDGNNFTKISKELHELYDYQTIPGDNNIYFRTLEDINKDGKLNNLDVFHYYRLDLNNYDYQLEEYNPLDVYK